MLEGLFNMAYVLDEGNTWVLNNVSGFQKSLGFWNVYVAFKECLTIFNLHQVHVIYMIYSHDKHL